VILEANSDSIAKAASLLREGRLVAFPTETVYGLGADATNDRAVASIYAVKGRPEFNPLIIHCAEISALDNLIEWNDTARLLASQFWPGAITLVLPRKKACPVSLLASAGLDTLAVRIPSHPVAQELLRKFGLPIAAPSANASGKLSPTTPVHVAESLGSKVDLILAGGRSQIGLESSVINLAQSKPVLLRHGGITREQIEKLIGSIDIVTDIENKDSILSPGMLASHYAPNISLRMNANQADADEALLTFGPDTFIKNGAVRFNLSEQGDLNEAAANLFSMLRQADQPHLRGIAVMPIPNSGLGVAINDRLKRACH
jgi:L-threonylcarbamoyladenylate synthase